MQTIRIAHSPDSDDAFMFYALATGKVGCDGFHFRHELHDIEFLNQAALEGVFEVTALSIHAYAYLHETYALLNCGASMGEGYGPVLVGRKEDPGVHKLAGKLIAVPGERTSAFLALKLREPNITHVVIPFDQIIPAVRAGRVDLGLVIHEGQLSYRREGLVKILDLGEWWQRETGLPLPLGGNAVRRNLGTETIAKLSELLRKSVQYALANKDEALQYAIQFGRGLDEGEADRFVNMYVNRRTLDYGDDGRQAVQLFLDRGFEAGLVPQKVSVAFD